jgi:hypothetical protein
MTTTTEAEGEEEEQEEGEVGHHIGTLLHQEEEDLDQGLDLPVDLHQGEGGGVDHTLHTLILPVVVEVEVEVTLLVGQGQSQDQEGVRVDRFLIPHQREEKREEEEGGSKGPDAGGGGDKERKNEGERKMERCWYTVLLL